MSIILDRPSVTAEEVALREDLVARVAETRSPAGRERPWSETDRRVVEDNITALDEAGLLSIMRPKRFGGLETDFRTKLEVSRELAARLRLDGMGDRPRPRWRRRDLL